MSLSRMELPPRPPAPPAPPRSGDASRDRISAPVTSTPSAEPATPFARVLRGLGRELDAGERVTRTAIANATARSGGADLSTVELIALQSQIYRYSEAVDLATKLVDRATSGLRTVIQGQ